MIPCPECGASHVPGTLFCDTCGAAVHPAAQAHVAATRTAAPAARPAAPGAAAPTRQHPDALTRPGDRPPPELLVHLPDRRQDISLRAAIIHIGRADPDAGFNPELDLTAYDALERGVSRRHATIQWAEGGFALIDQHSANGTWLEGARLVAGYAYQLPPRATVRFGDLVVQLAVHEQTE